MKGDILLILVVIVSMVVGFVIGKSYYEDEIENLKSNIEALKRKEVTCNNDVNELWDELQKCHEVKDTIILLDLPEDKTYKYYKFIITAK